MAHYRLRTHETITAHQWWQNGDHPSDLHGPDEEGELVRYYRHPGFMGTDLHPRCKHRYHDHGWIEPKHVHGMKPWEDGAMVCPGDYIVEQAVWRNGIPTFSVVSKRVFEVTYERIVGITVVEDIEEEAS